MKKYLGLGLGFPLGLALCVLSACQAQPVTPLSPQAEAAILAASEMDLKARQKNSRPLGRLASQVTAPPLGVTAPPLGVTAPPLGVTAPPLGVSQELKTQAFQHFDRDTDNHWNLQELEAYLQVYATQQASGFSTKSTLNVFSATSLMQRYDLDHDRLLSYSEAQSLHVDLYFQSHSQMAETEPGQPKTLNGVPQGIADVTEPITETLADTTDTIQAATEMLTEPISALAEVPQQTGISELTDTVSSTLNQSSQTVNQTVNQAAEAVSTGLNDLLGSDKENEEVEEDEDEGLLGSLL